MFLSFIRSFVCISSSYAEYDVLGTAEPEWPIASFPRAVGVSPIMQLPSELLHLIICWVDSTMLATCSLVCTRWMTHARARMFCRLSISMSNAHRFGHLFDPPLSRITFGLDVREIELEDSIIRDFWTTHVLPKFVVEFPRLNSLTLFGTVPPPLPHALQGVTHLDFNYYVNSTSRLEEGTSPDRLAAFISTFPYLESLKLVQENGASINFSDVSADMHPPPPPNLRRLDLDNPVFLPWIASAIPKPPVQAIRLDISRLESLKALESLRCFSTTLHALELIFSEGDVGESFLKENHLDRNTQLRTLRIQADHSQAAQILLKILSYIDSSCLQEISLDFAIPYLDSPVLTLLPWGALDAALAALPALCRLTVVKVLVSPHGWRSRINQRSVLMDAVQRMPLCRGFGVGQPPAELNSRPPSRAAGSRRYLTDLHTF
ncbi:F-box domain-containing protein [Mycena sanguinolenta]|uniref:F-box domain-containing protein n=1 Tax=Mycena sanguinolenta TaxID=230812 RepID=A0A8H6XBE4_9AGAR|nr:F-box domain-containing protein [Mycena sanguinolenta]